MSATNAPSRWRLYRSVPIAALLGALLAFVASFAISPKYVADTHLLINGTTSYLSSPAGGGGAALMGGTDAATAMADTQAALTSSRAVAEAVVDDLKLDQVPAKHHGILGTVKSGLSSSYKHVRAFLTYGSLPPASKHDVAVAAVQHALTATQVKTSYVLDLAVVWDDPKVAALIANSAADALVTQSKARYGEQQTAYTNQLKAEVDQAQQAQTDAQKAVSDYKSAHDLSDADVQQTLSAQNRQTLQTQVDTLTAKEKSDAAELASTQGTLASTPATTCGNQNITTGRGSTQVSNCGANPAYTALTQQVGTLKAALSGDAAQLASYQAALAHTSTGDKPLTTAQSELSNLAVAQTIAQDNFASLSAQYQQAQLTGSQQNVEVTHIDSAGAPLLPAGPVRTMYLAVGLLLGALLSFLVVHSRVLRRQRAATATAVDEPAVVDLVQAEAATAPIPAQLLNGNGHHPVSLVDAPHEPSGS